MRLELGSGYQPTAGYFHVDLNPNAPGVDRVAPAWPLDWVADGTVAEIRAVDVLEHLSYRDTGAVLADWARALAPRGRLFVQVPDADLIMRRFASGDQRLVTGLPADLPQTVLAGATWRLLGGHADGAFVADGDDFRLNAHYALFSVDSLRDAIEAAGLEVVRCDVNGHPNIQLWAAKP
jgi:predicted SAM-dependent methyltransferase